jgi:hypothetical protein
VKLHDGISLDKCLDDVRNSMSDKIERVHLLTKKDLLNIGNVHGIFNPERRHPNDVTSVQLWINEKANLGEKSPFLYFKNQGESHNLLKKEDFCLIIMTPSQQEMLFKFASDKICIDSTHGTNNYEFQLTTLVVVDEFGSGFPGAFCLSNKVDITILEIFFTKIKERIGVLKPNIFMSDDFPSYYNAWAKVMIAVNKQLLCTWHVDKNWRQALTKIAPKEKKIAVYKYARALMEETNVDTFHELLKTFLKELEMDPETHLFYKYFLSTYAQRYKLWAFCFRLNAGINTNMYLEAFHKVLKYAYMGGKKCKRLDSCISHLFKIVRDRTIIRFTQLIKGSNSTKVSEIHNRHKTSLTMPSTAIQQTNSSEWNVHSQKNANFTYTVHRENTTNCHNCKLICTFCQICIHQYTCTCIDSHIKINMCKHIHAVHRTSEQSSSKLKMNEGAIIHEIEQSESFKDTVQNNNIAHNIDLQSKLNYISNLLQKKAPANDRKDQIDRYMDKIISLIENEDETPNLMIEKSKKRKLVPQQRFYSTKKQKVGSSNSICKPSLTYKQAIVKSALSSSEIVNIHDEFDHNYTK